MARQYSEETKAAVMAALLTGQSVSSVAKEYQIPKGTVSSWKRKAESIAGGVEATPTQKADIGDLLLEYLRESLVTLREQVKFFRDRAWLAAQDASQLAVLHGVQTDKAVRLLEALSDGPEAEDV